SNNLAVINLFICLDSHQRRLVTIQADEQVYHGQVIAVMDELRTLEGVQLGIATEPKPSEQSEQ
ncbi:MAG: hypothetical protein F6K42_39415, partial [Leptolyngbya sp. SIO1D8]|nr:hypothetical protein [Leptolyngbya sp. SIO1D8]